MATYTAHATVPAPSARCHDLGSWAVGAFGQSAQLSAGVKIAYTIISRWARRRGTMTVPAGPVAQLPRVTMCTTLPATCRHQVHNTSSRMCHMNTIRRHCSANGEMPHLFVAGQGPLSNSPARLGAPAPVTAASRVCQRCRLCAPRCQCWRFRTRCWPPR